MHKIKISHECPISLLQESLIFNDYSYCLVHLLEEQPEYLKFFEDCRDNNRPVLLDNSIFELGTAFEPEKFAYWVDRLKPDEYIVPDVLESSKGTIDSLGHWMLNYKHLSGKTIGVVQGKTYEELVECYKAVDENCDKIAISFNYSYYEEIYPHSNKLVSWAMGRVMLLERMLREGVININKPHHLLGCSIPVEFIHYRNYKWIDSLDTSNPIVHGILGVSYNNFGLLSKESIKLFELITHQVTPEQIGLIWHNLKLFRNLIHD